jgi:hypothetical protein
MAQDDDDGVNVRVEISNKSSETDDPVGRVVQFGT